MIQTKIPIDKGILELQRQIGLGEAFFAHLLDEDDWSFIIKLHALIEAACTHLLNFHFKEPGLRTLLSRLELSNTTSGKIAFLKAVGLLGKEERRYIRALSELRNNLVHDVRNQKFDLNDTVDNFDQKALRNFAISFSPFESRIRFINSKAKKDNLLAKELTDQAELSNVIARAKEQPKFHIWEGAYWSSPAKTDNLLSCEKCFFIVNR